jgi:hypothetical protein
MKRTNGFPTIRTKCGLLASDLSRRVLTPRAKLEGTRPEGAGNVVTRDVPPGVIPAGRGRRRTQTSSTAAP